MDEQALLHGLINAAVSAVMPENFIPAEVHAEGSRLTIRGKSLDLSAFRHVYVISVGKAALGMAEALDKLIRPFVSEGIVVTKHLPASGRTDGRYRILRGGHPLPTAESVAAAEAVLALADRAGADDLVIFLISGGGSALMTAPMDGISLQTFQTFSDQILGCGADIKEFNTLRKHLDGVKGGRLAGRAAPARQITLILSDVVGSPLDVIASGPTVPDPTTYRDALDILDRYAPRADFPRKIRETLQKGAEGGLPETLKTALSGQDVFLLASNRTAAYAAAREAERLGIPARVINTRLTGEASAAGEMLPSFFSELEAPGILIFGGETTVHIQGKGTGGRNQELALAAVRPMAEWPGCTLMTLATDGEDGPTDAAGAIVTQQTLSRALECGCVPEKYLAENDAYHFFEKTGSLLRTGSTGTNVNDLTFLIRFH